jgi:hypothetical protein
MPTGTLNEIERLRRALRGSMSEKRPGPNDSADLNDIFELMLGTGARIGELLAVRWSEVDLASFRPTPVNMTYSLTGEGSADATYTVWACTSKTETVDLPWARTEEVPMGQRSLRRSTATAP